MNVVDSSGWLEYFSEGSNAVFFAEPIEASGDLLVPTISIYEVFKKVLLERDESEALRAVGFMQLGQVLDLTSTIALHAAKISADLKIPMADSVMLASARDFEAVLWSQDADFEELVGVEFVPKS
ncbi:MAG: type II toxin-antitoxin system VapC family toxin [Anaerolineales bacterium]